MAQLKGISIPKQLKRRVVAGTMATTLLFSLSGCSSAGMMGDLLSGAIADEIKPDVNRRQELLTDPNLVVYDFVDGSNSMYSGETLDDAFNSGEGDDSSGGGDSSEGSGGGGDFSTPSSSDKGTNANRGGLRTESTSWDREVDVAGFEPTTTSFASADDYNAYLREYFDGIVAYLEGNRNIYFRVFHRGYNRVADKTTVYEGEDSSGYKYVQSSPLDLKYSSNSRISSVQGTVINKFIYNWLGGLDINTSTHSLITARESLREQIASLVELEVLTWETTFESLTADQINKMGTSLYNGWKRVSSDYKTMTSYYSAVSNDPINNIPDLSLEYYTAWNARSTVVLNGASMKTKGSSNTSNTSTSVINIAFKPYNQYETRGVPDFTSAGTKTYCDDGMYVLTYLDGYNKTIVMLAAKEGMTLAEALGSGAGYEGLDAMDHYTGCLAKLCAWKSPADILATNSDLIENRVPANVRGSS